MNIIEAFDELRHGEKVRKKSWMPEEYLKLSEENPNLIYHVRRDKEDKLTRIIRYSVELAEINQDDEWEYYDDISEKSTDRAKMLAEIIRRASDELSGILGD